jgi:hypothetical protein
LKENKMTDRTNRLTEPKSRRGFLRSAGTAALGVAGASLLTQDADAQRGALDPQILNFALNLEYLEAEYYTFAVTGASITAQGVGVDGMGTQGGVTIKANPTVPFVTPEIQQMAQEIALDERRHVLFLRAALGAARVARPQIDLLNSFNAAAAAAGLPTPFDPFANENNFLLGAFIFEDVGVTAYKGAARFLSNKDFLEAAAGILAVEAYHSGGVRTQLLNRGFISQTQAISAARDSLDGPTDLDQGLQEVDPANVVPSDGNGIAFSRTPQQVRNIVYLNASGTPGGFFPNGLNGPIQ